MTEPNPLFLDGTTPTVTLAGKDWPVPMLAPRQNRHVVPAIIKLGPKFANLGNLKTVSSVYARVDEDVYGALLDACFWALRRAHPAMERDEFEDMPVTTNELMLALPVIAQQTGMIKKATAAEAAAAGEGIGAKSPLTGIESLPGSSPAQDGPGTIAKMN